MCFWVKLDLSIASAKKNNFKSFPTLRTLADDGDYTTVTGKVQNNVLSHLSTLKDEFACYFPEYSSGETQAIKKLIQNPFIVKHSPWQYSRRGYWTSKWQ